MLRTILIALLGMVLVVWCMRHKYDTAAPRPEAVSTEAVSKEDVSKEDGWRRTSQGWERNTAWAQAMKRDLPRVTQVHPSIVATLVLLVSLGALIALPLPEGVGSGKTTAK